MIKYVLIGDCFVRTNGRFLPDGAFHSDDFTYPARRVKDWDELTDEQKRRSISNVYEQKREGIAWGLAKDPTLRPLKKKWQDALDREYNRHLAELSPFVDEE